MPVALILGCAECVWDDANAALAMFEPDAVFGVKNMMVLWPGRVDYGINLHPDRTHGYLNERRRLGRNVDFEVWSHKSFVITGNRLHKRSLDWQGSTGLFAVKVALMEEEFDGVVLAGVPMDAKYGHVARKAFWQSATMFRKGWQVHLPEIRDKVRSMSGWTKELLGEPTPEWLAALGSAPPAHNVVQELASQ